MLAYKGKPLETQSLQHKARQNGSIKELKQKLSMLLQLIPSLSLVRQQS